MPCRPSTSTSNVRPPPVASATASAAATVVLPVPPLPVTTCKRARTSSSGHPVTAVRVNARERVTVFQHAMPLTGRAAAFASVHAHDHVGVRDCAAVDACHQADPRPMGRRRLGAGHRDARSDRRAVGGLPQAPQEPVSWSGRLAELGLALPPVATPAGMYLPAVRSGSLVFTAGQVPLVDGAMVTTG